MEECLPHKCKTIHLRHIDICDQNVDLMLLHISQRFFSIMKTAADFIIRHLCSDILCKGIQEKLFIVDKYQFDHIMFPTDIHRAE